MKPAFLLVGILLFPWGDTLDCAADRSWRSGGPQDQEQRSEFYALQVIDAKFVQNAGDSLRSPDGRYAEILPGGQLVVLMENILLPSPMVGNGEDGGCLDSGSVVGRGGEDFGLEGRFTWQDAQGEERHEWISLVPSPTGFCISPPALEEQPSEDVSGVDLVRITNLGEKSLFVDAVIGYTLPLEHPEAAGSGGRSGVRLSCPDLRKDRPRGEAKGRADRCGQEGLWLR